MGYQKWFLGLNGCKEIARNSMNKIKTDFTAAGRAACFSFRRIMWLAGVMGLGLLGNRGAVADTILLSPLKNLFTANTTLTSTGRKGEIHELLFGTDVKGIRIPLARERVSRSSIASFLFSTSGKDAASFYLLQVTNLWVPSSIELPEYGLRILSLPEDQIAPTNGTAIFMIQAESLNTNDVLTYQWIFNDATNVSGATNAALVLTGLLTNVHVGFYTCDLRAGTNLVYRARSRDWDAPGTRLFVFAGTTTPVTGPYQPAYPNSAVTCGGALMNYIGSVQFLNPDVPQPTTYFARPSTATKFTATDRTTGISNYRSLIYVRETSAAAPICGTSPLGPVMANPPPRYYQFTIYVLSGDIATGDLSKKITLDVSWQ